MTRAELQAQDPQLYAEMIKERDDAINRIVTARLNALIAGQTTTQITDHKPPTGEKDLASRLTKVMQRGAYATQARRLHR